MLWRMPSDEVRHPLLNICRGDQQLSVDILCSGEVRLRLHHAQALEIRSETLENLLQDAAACPLLSAELYEQLHWELDMLALRGN